jgi:hypothetical protein
MTVPEESHAVPILPRPPLGPAPRRGTPERRRLALGVGLVAALAIAWIGFAARSTPADSPADASVARTTGAPTTSTVPARAATIPSWVPPAIASTCRARTAAAPATVVVDCAPGRGVDHLRYRSFTTAAALEAAGHGHHAPTAAAGASRCARGEPDERAWSTAAAPARAAGRYRCTRSRAGARIVWTDEATHVLAFATRDDGDLGALYAWWTTVPGPNEAAAAR